jgi:hypothetical protein
MLESSFARSLPPRRLPARSLRARPALLPGRRSRACAPRGCSCSLPARATAYPAGRGNHVGRRAVIERPLGALEIFSRARVFRKRFVSAGWGAIIGASVPSAAGDRRPPSRSFSAPFPGNPRREGSRWSRRGHIGAGDRVHLMRSRRAPDRKPIPGCIGGWIACSRRRRKCLSADTKSLRSQLPSGLLRALWASIDQSELRSPNSR